MEPKPAVCKHVIAPMTSRRIHHCGLSPAMHNRITPDPSPLYLRFVRPRSHCAWEFVITLRKFLAAIVIVFAGRAGAGVQLLLLMLVCGVALALQMLHKPFRSVPLWNGTFRYLLNDVQSLATRASSLNLPFRRRNNNNKKNNNNNDNDADVDTDMKHVEAEQGGMGMGGATRGLDPRAGPWLGASAQIDLVNVMEAMSILALIVTQYLALYVYTNATQVGLHMRTGSKECFSHCTTLLICLT